MNYKDKTPRNEPYVFTFGSYLSFFLSLDEHRGFFFFCPRTASTNSIECCCEFFFSVVFVVVLPIVVLISVFIFVCFSC
jgi:hypothetical protein